MTTSWWPVIEAARWFAGKGRGGHLERAVDLPELAPGLRPVLVTVGYPDGSRELYQVLDAGGVDIAARPEALSGLADALNARTTSSDGGWTVRCELARSAPELPRVGTIFGGEQSNTSVMLGPALVKVLRRLEPGRTLEASALEALRGSAWVPALYGRIDATDPGGAAYDLAAVCERVPDAGNGWDFALAEAAARGDADWARDLGEGLAELHALFAERLGTSTLRGDEVAQAMRNRLHAAAEQVAELRPIATETARLFAPLEGHPVPVQRLHGDFHLGQTLRSGSGWRIIDFEGEPMKTLAERALHDSVARDLAGMLRSIDYARASAREPDSVAARDWAKRCQSAFLAGYTSRRGTPFSADETTIIRAYLADKALYEVVYEARNRPDWLPIPLSAVQHLLKEQS